MAIAIVQSKGTDAASGSSGLQLTLTSNVTSANLLVALCVIQDPSEVISAGQVTGGGTWALTKTINNPNPVSTGQCGIFECDNATGGATTVTFNPGSTTGDGIALAVYELSGAAASPDDGQNATNFSSTTTSPTAGNIVTSAAGGIVFGFCADGTNTQTWAAQTAWTLGQHDNNAGNIAYAVVYQLTGSAGTYNPGITATTANNFSVVGAAFKSSGGGGGTPLFRNANLDGCSSSGPFFGNLVPRTLKKIGSLFVPDRRILIPA
jgi:hypothetical protein